MCTPFNSRNSQMSSSSIRGSNTFSGSKRIVPIVAPAASSVASSGTPGGRSGTTASARERTGGSTRVYSAASASETRSNAAATLYRRRVVPVMYGSRDLDVLPARVIPVGRLGTLPRHRCRTQRSAAAQGQRSDGPALALSQFVGKAVLLARSARLSCGRAVALRDDEAVEGARCPPALVDPTLNPSC